VTVRRGSSWTAYSLGGNPKLVVTADRFTLYLWSLEVTLWRRT
jgi:hypothetical protein